MQFLRYGLTCREASDIIKKGKMCSLFINDLDAGAGRMGAGTQYTVNNQMVNATLMNIADNPSNVQLPGVYKQETIPRVPIVCTGQLSCKVSNLCNVGMQASTCRNTCEVLPFQDVNDFLVQCMHLIDYETADVLAVHLAAAS